MDGVFNFKGGHHRRLAVRAVGQVFGYPSRIARLIGRKDRQTGTPINCEIQPVHSRGIDLGGPPNQGGDRIWNQAPARAFLQVGLGFSVQQVYNRVSRKTRRPGEYARNMSA
jgi:hypothetical protein